MSSPYDPNLAYGSSPGRTPSDPYNSDLAYGSSSSSSSSPERGFSTTVGQASFASTDNGSVMSEVAQYVSRLPSPTFEDALQAAGDINIRFGRTTGGGVGEWRPDDRTVMLNPNHRDVRESGRSRLMGAAVFEILNAATDPNRLAIEARAVSGEVAQEAARNGITPKQQFGREIEFLEFNNALTHRGIMTEAGRQNSRANLFVNETNDFEAYYRRQVAAGHSHSYEFRYSLLTTPRPSQSSSQGAPGIPGAAMTWDPAAARANPAPGPAYPGQGSSAPSAANRRSSPQAHRGTSPPPRQRRSRR